MNQNNGIVKWFSENGGEYTFWTHSDYIKDEYIYPYLKQRFPHRLIINEFNKIDYVIAEENIPIEVQSTIIHTNRRASPQYSRFEQLIEKQIRQNINDTGICYLFFDSELLRAMESAKNRRGCNISINLDWLRKLMKEGKLKVFTVRYDGLIEEKNYKVFDFLSSVSQTCIIAAETDDIILNKNKIKIYTNVIKGYSFNQDELDKFDISWKDYCKETKTKKIDTKLSFWIRHNDIRAKLYARVLSAVSNLRYINDIMNRKYNSSAKSYASTLGIFDAEGGSSNYSRTMFVDKFDICRFFPGYIKNKELWDNLKGKRLISLQFCFALNKGYIPSEAPDWHVKRAELDLKILDLLPRRQNEIWRKLGIKARACSSILTRLEKEGKIKRTEAKHKTLFVERG